MHMKHARLSIYGRGKDGCQTMHYSLWSFADLEWYVCVVCQELAAYLIASFIFKKMIVGWREAECGLAHFVLFMTQLCIS